MSLTGLSGLSGLSAVIPSGCSIPAAPSPVVNVSGAGMDVWDVTVSWAGVDGATAYDVQDPGYEAQFNGVTDTYYYIGQRGPGEYPYRVRAKNDCGTSGWADTSLTLPPP